MTHRPSHALPALALAVLASACTIALPTPVPSIPLASKVPEPLLKAIAQDAAKRAGVDATQVKVGSVQNVTWSDGSLGCPQPGRMYPQVLMPGWRIDVRAGNAAWDYHASQQGSWLWCPAGQSLAPASAQSAL